MKKPLMGEFDTVKLDGRRTSKPAIRPLAHYGLLFILFYMRVSILIFNYAFQNLSFGFQDQIQYIWDRASIRDSQSSLDDCVCTFFLTSNLGGHPAAIQLSTRHLKTDVPFKLCALASWVSLVRISLR